MPPKFVYPRVLVSTRNVVAGAPFDESGTDSVLLKTFKDKLAKLDLSVDVKEKLIDQANAALLASVKPAYAALIAELERQDAAATTDDGVWKFPSGEEFYASRLKNYTTTDLTADEIREHRGTLTTPGIEGPYRNRTIKEKTKF